MKQSLYAILGLEADCSQEDIHEAYEQKMAQAKDNNTKVVIRHAKETLGNPLSRAAYDNSLTRAHPPSIAPTHSRDAVFARSTSIWPRIAAIAVLAVLLVWLGMHWLKKAPTPNQRERRFNNISVQQNLNSQPNSVTYPTAVPIQGKAMGTAESIYANASASIVTVDAVDQNGRTFSRGSGIIVGPQQVITNCHVVQGAASVKVRSGASEFVASSGASDTYLDLCMLQVNNLTGPEAIRGSVRNVRVGQPAYAIGSPHGLDRTLSEGLVSALRDTPDGTIIQTSAAISPGSSGGGLFDSEGRLIGITTFQHKYGQNLNFALPVDWLDTMRTR